ncbi:MAG: RICIN domain-containing protein [Chitinophagales bacterium]
MKFLNNLSVPILILLTFFCTITSMAQNGQEPINPDYWYRISSLDQGDAASLTALNNGNDLQLKKTMDAPEQYWKLNPIKDGWYRLISKPFRKDKKCLGVVNDGVNNNRPHLVLREKNKGQLWKIRPAKDGSIQLSTMAMGDDQVLELSADGQYTALLGAQKGQKGQFWKLTKIKMIASAKKNVDVANTPPQKTAATRGRGRGTSRGSAVRRAQTPVVEQGEEIVKEPQAEPNFLEAEKATRFKAPEIIEAATPKNAVLKGTQLKVSAPPSDWYEYPNPISLTLLQTVIVNGKSVMPEGSTVLANVHHSGERNYLAKDVQLELLSIETEAKLVPLVTNKVKVTEFTDAFHGYVGSDANFEIPIETGILLELQQNADLD